MVKLGDKQTHQEWLDFQKYLIQMGWLMPKLEDNNQRMLQLLQMTFKQALVTGAQMAATQEQVTYQKPKSVVPEIAKRLTRNIESRTVRSIEQRQKDNKAVEIILQEHIDPMPLAVILHNMRVRGFTHWNNNNASGFMKQAIKDGYRIKKTQLGIYAFDFGDGGHPL